MKYHILFDWMMILFSVQIIRTYLKSFYPLIHKHTMRYIIWGVYILFQYFVIFFDIKYSIPILIFNIILVVLLDILSNSSDCLTALFRSEVFYAIWIAIEAITQNFILATEIHEEYIIAMGNIISKIVIYITVYLRKQTQRKKTYTLIPFWQWIRLLFVPNISIFIIYRSHTLMHNSNSNITLTAIALFVILINYMLFDIYEKISTCAFMERQNSIYAQEIQLCIKQSVKQESEYRQTRALHHDLNALLIGLKVLLEEERNSDAILEINKMLDLNNVGCKAAHSGNPALDALVNSKFSIALIEDIKITCRLEVPAELPVDVMDLCVILGNLLDNALEAVHFLTDVLRWVDLAIWTEKGTLGISVRNPFKGKILKNDQGGIQSTKKDKIFHGIGLESVQRITDKYNGIVSFRYDDEIFQAVVLLYI